MILVLEREGHVEGEKGQTSREERELPPGIPEIITSFPE
jgi:hypothetical protein